MRRPNRILPSLLVVVLAACVSSSSSDATHGPDGGDAGAAVDASGVGDAGAADDGSRAGDAVSPTDGATDASTNDASPADGATEAEASACGGTVTALHFTMNDTVAIADSASLAMGAAGTIEAWVLLDVPEAGAIPVGHIYNKWVSAAEDKDLQVFAGGDARGVLFVSGSSIPTVQSTNPVATNRWTHLAMAYDTTSMRLYVDGVQVASQSGAFTPANSNGVAHIGFEPREVGYQAALLGFISEVRISSVARYVANFTPSAHLASDGSTSAFWKLDEGTGTTAADSSGNANTGTITGAAWTTAPCR